METKKITGTGMARISELNQINNKQDKKQKKKEEKQQKKEERTENKKNKIRKQSGNVLKPGDNNDIKNAEKISKFSKGHYSKDVEFYCAASTLMI